LGVAGSEMPLASWDRLRSNGERASESTKRGREAREPEDETISDRCAPQDGVASP